jgi:hypothetical protein
MGRLRFELLHVLIFNVLHELGAAHQISGGLARHHGELIVNGVALGERAARGDPVRSPLIHHTEIPENQERRRRGCGNPTAAFVPGASKPIDALSRARPENNVCR